MTDQPTRRRAPHARRPDRKRYVGRERGRAVATYEWEATCSCGWIGSPRTRQSQATADYRAHRAEYYCPWCGWHPLGRHGYLRSNHPDNRGRHIECPR